MGRSFVTAVLAALLASACGEGDPREAAPPAPVEITRDHIGYYCNMIVADHRGPKGQIHIDGREAPVWFSSVRDAIVFTLLPEEPKNIAAIYVNDMGRARWDAPEAGTWIDARTAWYVIGSDRRGGMGAPEAVPFEKQSDAETFAGAHGGEVVAFADVPRDYVLDDASRAMRSGMHESTHGHGALQAGAGDHVPAHAGHDDKREIP